MVEKRFASSILDVRSFRGADCGTDHYLMKTKLRYKIKKNKKESTKPLRRYNITKLMDDPNVAMALGQRIKHRLNLGCEERGGPQKNVDTWWKIKNIIHEVAAKKLGVKIKQSRADWFNAKFREALQKKEKTYKEYIQRPTRIKWDR